MEREKMQVGRVTGAHGIAGEVRVTPLTDAPDRFAEFETVFIGPKEYEVTGARLHQGKVLLRLTGIADRTAAEKLRGQTVEIPRDEAQPLDEDEFYIADLIGASVFGSDGERIGRLRDVLQTTGGNDTAEITVESAQFRPDAKEEKQAMRPLFLPFRSEFFVEIDAAGGRITVDVHGEYWEL